jgi:hypothetical protein
MTGPGRDLPSFTIQRRPQRLGSVGRGCLSNRASSTFENGSSAIQESVMWFRVDDFGSCCGSPGVQLPASRAEGSPSRAGHPCPVLISR